MNDLFVRRVYRSHGVSVIVELDYVEKTVSLVEKNGKNKSWMFAGRTPQYLNGWRNILKAMEYAVEQAQKELNAISEGEHQEFVKMYVELDKALKPKKDGEQNGR